MTFAQICAASPSTWDSLRQRIEECAQQGKSYEFSVCQMPAGCVPSQVSLGFVRQGERYLLYWRPMAVYHGESRVLRLLFARNIWRFETFETLTARLQSLRREVESSELRQAVPEQRSFPAQWGAAALWPPLYPQLKAELSREVLGQDSAVEAAAFRLSSHVGKREPARPLSLIFHGPTGVGKSELGKALAPALSRCCGRPYRLVWTDLNTFTQPHAVHRLTGAPPGYVGYEDSPIFEAVRQEPYTVFMFDELEKAHPEVLKVFMSILDEGRCTAHRADAEGERELDFRRCVLVFTTNADLGGKSKRLGFSSGEPGEAKPSAGRRLAETPGELAERLYRETEEARQAMIRQGVLAEIAGRFGGIIGFQPLDDAARLAITMKQVRALGREFGLEVTQIEPAAARALTPDKSALSVRSSAAVLEGLLTPLFAMTKAGEASFRLSGLPGNFQLTPLLCGRTSNSSTVLAAESSR